MSIPIAIYVTHLMWKLASALLPSVAAARILAQLAECLMSEVL